MSILEDIDTSQWGAKELKAALDFLYGDVEKYFEQVAHMHAYGDHKPKTQYLVEYESPDLESQASDGLFEE